MDKSPIEMLDELVDLENNTVNKKKPTLIDIYLELFLEIAVKINKEVFIKGNVLLNKLYADTARSTIDLDISVVSTELYNSVIVPELKIFGDNAVNCGIASSYVIKEIQDNRSGGIDVRDNNNTTIYSVDVSKGDINPLGLIKYNFNGIYAYGSSIEKILCDKCLSTLSHKRFRRVKDFYDLYIILSSKVNYNSEVVLRLMIDKVEKEEVKSLLSNQPFSDEVVNKSLHAWNKLELFSDKDGREIPHPDFLKILQLCYTFYRNIEYYLYK